MTFYAQQQSIIRFAQGKQPQIKISDLGSIPFPAIFEFQNQLVNIVDEINESKDNIQKIKTEINNAVFDYYQITETQISHIQKSIKDF